MAQFTKCLSYKHKDPSLLSTIHIKKARHYKVRCGGMSLKSQYREGEDRKIPVAHRPASLAYLGKLQIQKSYCLKNHGS